ncbi:MAG: hypothetical protein E7360_01540 [Clostridiales bacterium]|nr:hypothetical protein [Clostridiales bacterium]
MKTLSRKFLILVLTLFTVIFSGAFVYSVLGVNTAFAATSVTVTASNVSSHTATATSGMYFKATENAAPYDGSWGLRYKTTSADAITLTRNGVTTNVGNTEPETLVKFTETEYFIESWTVGVNDNGWQVGDVYTLNGSFYNAANDATITFENVQLQIVAVTDNAPTVLAGTFYQAGQMYANATTVSSTANGIYLSTIAVKGAPSNSDWSVEYKPVLADNIKITRGGETVSVANKDAGTVVKTSERDYYLKIESHTTSNYAPLQDGDVVTVSGWFYKDSTYINFEETVITYSGDAFTFSTDMSAEAKPMSSHTNGGKNDGTGFYFTMEDNGTAYDSNWSVEYAPTSADNVKLTRGGETVSVGNTGAGTVVKTSATDYYFKTEGWMNGTYFPLKDGDVLTISGAFVGNTFKRVTVNIEETKVTYSGGVYTFSTPTVYEAGQMYAHESGIKADENGGGEKGFGFYFKTDANEALHGNGDWNIEYGATSVDNIKLTRDGVTTSVAVVGQGTIVRLNEIDHYMKFVPWTTSGVLPVQEGDVFTVSGTFKCTSNDLQMFKITETAVTYTNGTLKYSTDPVVHEAGPMYTHENGIKADENGGGEKGFGFYFKTDANDALHGNGDWNVEYGATSVDNIKLTRDGETTSVAVVGQGTIVRLNEIDHYMKFVPWTTSGVLPVQEGDVFTISGTFKCTSDATQMFEITETTVTYTKGALKYSTDPEVHEVGQMYSHTSGATVTLNGGWAIHFITDENNAPYNADWSLEYQATTVDNVKLTRNGETTSVANLGQGLIVKFGENEYCFKAEAWTLSCGRDFVDGDVLTVSGQFIHPASNAIINITETTLTYKNGRFAFSTDPEVYEAGQMYSHENGVNLNEYEGNGFGFYFKTDANDAAYKGDWSIEYGATSVDNIKLTRNGVTTSVAKVGQGTIVKINETDHYIKFVPWTVSGVLPVQDGDVFTISGVFKCIQDATQMFNIEETTVMYKNGELKYVRGFSMLDGAGVRLNSDKMGIRFTAEIGATYDADATYHVLIVPNEYLTLLNITGDYYTQLREKLGESAYIATMEALPFQATAEDAEKYGLTQGLYYVRGSLTTIQYNNMNTKFFGIAYSVKDGVYTYATFNEGENVRSLVEVSSLALCDEKYKDNETLQGFVNRGMNNSLGNADSTTYNGTIELSKNTLNYLDGYPINVKLTLGLPEGADVEVIWSSSDPETVAVDGKGNVIGLKTGSATITATCMGETYTCEVTNQAGARPMNLKLKGKILSWDALAEIDTYKVTIKDLATEKDSAQVVNGTLVDVSDFDLTEDNEYTAEVCAVVGDKETTPTTFKFKYDEYGESYVYASESGETLSVGVWNGSYHFSDPAKIKELADAGYNLILHVNPIMGHDSLESFLAVLDKAYEYGVSLMVDPRSYNGSSYTQWSGNINDAQTYSGTSKSFIPKDYLTHPAIVGVVGWEEPNEDAITADGLNTIEEAFKASKGSIGRNDLEFFVNFLPRSGNSSTDFDAYLDGYADKLDNKSISLDDYALVRNSSNALYIRKSYFETLAVATAKAKAEGVPFWYTLLSCAHNTEDTKYHYTAPTAEEIRWQMAVGMAFGAQNLTHYTYTSHDTTNYTSTMVEYGTFEKTALFNTIAGVNAEYLAWDEIYRNYAWKGFTALDFGDKTNTPGTGFSAGTYTANALMLNLESKTGVKYYDYTQNGLKSVNMTSGNNEDAAHNSKDLLVGTFQDANGNNAFMITNAGSAVNTQGLFGSNITTDQYYVNLAYTNVAFNVKLTFDSGYVGAWIINKGVKTYQALTDNALTLNVAAWDGAFVIPVKAQGNLGTVTVNGFEKEDNSVSWNAVENAYAYEVVITRDGEKVVDTVVFDTKYVFDEVVFGDYVVTVTARNDGQYQASSGTSTFTLGLK